MLQSPIGADKDIKFKWVGEGSRNLNMVIHMFILNYKYDVFLFNKKWAPLLRKKS